MTAAELLARLEPCYAVRDWWPSGSPFETAVGAILVQGVAWRNAAKAIEGLRTAGLLSSEGLAGAGAAEVAAAVRPALYHNQKARYLLAFARFVEERGGLRSLRELPRAAQRTALLGVAGIGEETAAAIMVYALGGAEPVVDAYARRLLPRVGAVGKAEDAEFAAVMRQAIGDDPGRARRLHALIVEHARAICRKNPRCGVCPIADTCPRLEKLA